MSDFNIGSYIKAETNTRQITMNLMDGGLLFNSGIHFA